MSTPLTATPAPLTPPLSGASLSQVLLNPRRVGARRLLSDRQALHAAVRSAWPGHPDTHPLWRLEPAGEPGTPPALLVVGPAAPSWSHLTEQAGWEAHPGQVRDYAPVVDVVRAHPDAVYRFALDANPSSKDTGTRRFLASEADQLEWLRRQGDRHGFRPELVTVSASALPDRFRRGRSTVTLPVVRFTGTLTVTDPDAFASALTSGIGRGKAYGCGLMTIARA